MQSLQFLNFQLSFRFSYFFRPAFRRLQDFLFHRIDLHFIRHQANVLFDLNAQAFLKQIVHGL